MKILLLPNGKFRVDTIIGGKRERRNFVSRAMAESFLKRCEAERYETSLGMGRLSARQRMVAMEVFRVLPPEVDLVDVVLRHVKKVKFGRQSISLQELQETFLESLKIGNRRPSYIQSIGQTLKRFAKSSNWGEAADIGSPEIEEFLKVCRSPISRFNHIRDLNVFFEWARVQKYLEENPVAEIRRPLIHRKEPVILTVEQARSLLENTSGADRAMAVIGLFAGIRPSEIRQMTWKMVNDTSIRLPAEITKTHTSRTIQLEPNAMAWLAPLREEAPRMDKDEGSQGKRLCLAAGLKSWPQGALRHTFASYHVTAFENPGRTALFMHCRLAPDILFRHYFKDTLKSEAEAFWQIYPKEN